MKAATGFDVQFLQHQTAGRVVTIPLRKDLATVDIGRDGDLAIQQERQALSLCSDILRQPFWACQPVMAKECLGQIF